MLIDDPLLELWEAAMLSRFTKMVFIHDALCQAYTERTGLELAPESDYTVAETRRACRILLANGWPPKL